MRDRASTFVGVPFVRAVCPAFLVAVAFLVCSGLASAQSMWPEPTAVATTGTLDAASGTLEFAPMAGSTATSTTTSTTTTSTATASAGATSEAAKCDAGCSMGGQDSCGCFCPRWTIRAGAIFLDRERPRDVVMVTEGFSPQSRPILNANEFDPGVGWGFELSAIRHRFLDTCWDLEGRYFGIEDWSASTDPVRSFGGAVFHFATPAYTEKDTDVSSEYHSQLRSVELNLRRPVNDWLQILAGVRYIGLNEAGLNMYLNMNQGEDFANARLNADNDLWGFQLGADARIWSWDRLSIELLGKAGIYGNSANNSFTVDQTASPYHFGVSSTNQNHAAFEGELGLTACYQINDHLAFRFGYQVMWIDGVALSTDQMATIQPDKDFSRWTSRGVNTDGSPFYHGGVISLEYRH